MGLGFSIGIKLNASDFQRGGFTHAECLRLVKWLNASGLDLLELSGGSLEQPKIVGCSIRDEGKDARPSTAAREAYFVAVAGAVRAVAAMPVMVTGGFRTAAAMAQALSAGELDVIGIGRPFVVDPGLGAKLISGEVERAYAAEDRIGLPHILPWFNTPLERLADGLDPDLTITGDAAAVAFGPWRLTPSPDCWPSARLPPPAPDPESVAILKLAHFAVRARDLATSRRFYDRVLGVRAGARPPFDFPGVWLYAGAEESGLGAVHLIGAGSPSASDAYLGLRTATSDGAGAVDHIALFANDWPAMRAR